MNKHLIILDDNEEFARSLERALSWTSCHISIHIVSNDFDRFLETSSFLNPNEQNVILLNPHLRFLGYDTTLDLSGMKLFSYLRWHLESRVPIVVMTFCNKERFFVRHRIFKVYPQSHGCVHIPFRLEELWKEIDRVCFIQNKAIFDTLRELGLCSDSDRVGELIDDHKGLPRYARNILSFVQNHQIKEAQRCLSFLTFDFQCLKDYTTRRKNTPSPLFGSIQRYFEILDILLTEAPLDSRQICQALSMFSRDFKQLKGKLLSLD